MFTWVNPPLVSSVHWSVEIRILTLYTKIKTVNLYTGRVEAYERHNLSVLSVLP